MSDEPFYKNSQSQKVKYLGDANVICTVCSKDNMKVRSELPDRAKGTITQSLECPRCAHTYPRVVAPDRKTVLHDPFSDLKKIL